MIPLDLITSPDEAVRNRSLDAACADLDLAALLAWARANPGGFRVAHAGVATVTHLVMSAVVQQARAEFTLVPYRGGAQQATDLLGGTIEGSADLPAALIPQAAAGRRIVTAVPRPGSLRACTRPACRSTMRRTMASPRPWPPSLFR